MATAEGHAVRRNVAQRFAALARGDWRLGDDLWARIFELADATAREEDKSDLVPYWVAPGAFKVECVSPTLPYTREVEALRRLRRQRATYRVVFGQPRQEELQEMLERAGVSQDVLSQWMISLAPWRGRVGNGRPTRLSEDRRQRPRGSPGAHRTYREVPPRQPHRRLAVRAYTHASDVNFMGNTSPDAPFSTHLAKNPSSSSRMGV